jgi:hypothetical protein
MFLVGCCWIPNPVEPILNGAIALVGRPATPGSVAGVARRTTRRTVPRIAIGTRVTRLPGGCTKLVVRAATYHNCNGVYYRPHYEGTKLVYVVVDKP